jgi:hypothetical protein
VRERRDPALPRHWPGPDATRTRLVAGLLAAVIGSVVGIAVSRILDGDDVEEVRRDQVGVLDRAFDLLEHGVGDYGRR